MKMIAICLAAGLGFVCAGGISHAAPTTYTWANAADGSWSANGNWNPATGHPGSDLGDTAVFDAATGRIVTLDASQSFFNFNATGAGGWVWTNTANTLTLSGRINYSSTNTSTIHPMLAGNMTLNVSTGALMLANTANSFIGNINIINGGTLMYSANAAQLGNAANVCYLGSECRSGTLMGYAPTLGYRLYCSNSIVINGPAGFIDTWMTSGGIVDLCGPISGPGALIAGGGGQSGALTGSEIDLRGTNTSRGGVHFPAIGYVYAYANSLGSNNVYISCPNGNSVYVRAGAINSNASVFIGCYAGLPASLTLWVDASHVIPNIDSASGGALLLPNLTTMNANIKNRLAAGQPQLGNGHMMLSGNYSSAVFDGASLLIGADNTYGFGGFDYNSSVDSGLTLDVPSSTAGVLVDQGAPAKVQTIGRLYFPGPTTFPSKFLLKDVNTYSGDTIIGFVTTLTGYLQTNNSPIGASTGNIKLNGGTLQFETSGAPGGATVVKNDLAVTGAGTLTMNGTSTVSVVSITRTNRGVLFVGGANLGSTAKAQVTGASPPVSANGMVLPWQLHADNDFVDYNGTDGYKKATYTKNVTQQSDYDGITGTTDIVNVTSDLNIAGTKTNYALKTSMALTNATGTLLLGSGGLILTGAKTHTANFDFGSAEGVIHATAANTISGTISGSGGLTKTGAGILTLAVSNTLAGDIVIAGGALVSSISSPRDAVFGAAGNAVILNGGQLMAGNILTTSRTIKMGVAGGYVYGAVFNGRITDAPGGGGILMCRSVTITNGANDYTGGTWFLGGGNSVAAGGKLGTGDVLLEYNTASFAGDGNIHTNAMLVLMRSAKSSLASVAQFTSAAPEIGGLQGIGVVTLGSAGVNTILTLGGNNRDTHYYGNIGQVSGQNCGLNKKGAGTFNLWGNALHTGATTVSNGAMIVNGYMAGPLRVASVSGNTPVLGGNGTIAGNVTAARGRIVPGSSVGLLTTGNLALDSASTLAIEINTNGVAGTDYDQLKISGTVNLNSESGAGSTLSVTLGYVPKLGDAFTIIDNDGSMDAVSGRFSNTVLMVPYGATTNRFKVSYNGGDGNDVVMTRCETAGTVILFR